VSRRPEATLTAEQWRRRSERHERRVNDLLGGYLEQRSRGATHPVIDFLFTYYNLQPSQLLRWHPGYGVVLADAAPYADLRGYCRTERGVTASAEHLARRRETIAFVATLLEATAARPAHLGCFGLHEWAMVYKSDTVRHGAVPLRLGHAGTDKVVESLALRCTHYDAFRFFTEPARPRNAAPLTREAQVATEQPGCLHAGMDLYKYGAKLLPLVDSELLMDAFELAYSARELDMRASPYALGFLGYEPVPIETPAGRAEYVRQQSAIAEQAVEVRARLLQRCRELLEVTLD
jgi:hypothetical protein